MNKSRLPFLGLVLAFVLIYPTLWQASAASGELGDTLFSTEKVFSSEKGEQSNWWDTDWGFRIGITVGMVGIERDEKPVEIELDFASILNELGVSSSVNADSLRVLEVDSSGTVIANNVPFQYDPVSSNTGVLTVLLTGKTAVSTERYYHLYFGLQGSGTYPPPNVPDRITVADNVIDEGFSSVKIVTEIGTYYYHKEGGGFSSLNDIQGQDWISYSSASGAAGEFRGIPNLVPPAQGGYFHPGYSFVTTNIVSQGPLKASILSTTNDDKWQVLWEIFPRYAQLSVLKIPTNANHWFLYEGTPGGALDTGNDYVVRSDGRKTLTSVDWQQDLKNEEWVYFAEGDPAVNRSLFLVHHENDSTKDSYFPLFDLMTVFGFARLRNDSSNGYFTESGHRFTIGLVDDEDQKVLGGAIRSAYRDLSISFTAPERRSYKLEIISQGQGEVNASPELPAYTYGQQATLQAKAALGWEFGEWKGDLLGNDPNPTIVIEDNTEITAVFSQKEYELAIAPVGKGVVTKSPDREKYHYGDVVTLDAIASNGWLFKYWEGSVEGTNSSVKLTIDGNETVYAVFTKPIIYLPVTFSRK